MNKSIFKNSKKFGLIGMAILVCLVFIMACNLIFPGTDPKVVYQPKSINGTIDLPAASNLDVSQCNIQSVYGDAVIKGNSFTLDVESATVQQMIYFSNANGDILMAGFINSNEKDVTINSESTSVALIMLLLQAGGDEVKEWDKLVAKVKANKSFPALKAEIEYLIENEVDIFSEDNTDLMYLCGDLINDISGALKSTLKSTLVDKDVTPLVITTSGNTVSITNNGKSPLYQITVTKDGAQVGQQTLLAADPLKISVGNILTWKWGLCNAPSPIEFKLDKTGDYEFRASSWDADALLLSPRFNNALLITNQLLNAAGFPLSNECAKVTADFMYNLMVSTVIDMRTMDKDVNDAIRIFLDFMLMKAGSFASLIADCSKDTNPAKLSEYTEKFVKVAKFGLRCIDVLGKAQAGGNAAALLGFWAYQPTEITFCKHYENNGILTCGAGSFNAVTCNLSCDQDFLFYSSNWSSSNFYIGQTYVPTSSSITSSNFQISAKDSYNQFHTVQVNGLIKDKVITDISFTDNNENYMGGVLEDSWDKKLVLTNLSISLNDISNDGYTSIVLTKAGDNLVSISETSKYRYIVTNELVTSYTLSSFSSDIFNESGKIQINFSTVK